MQDDTKKPGSVPPLLNQNETMNLDPEMRANAAEIVESESASPLPSDFTVLNLEKDRAVLVEAGMDLDESWDLLISSGSGNLGPAHSGGTATYGK